MKRWLWTFLVAEILTSVLVVYLFRMIEDRYTAALVAGTLFILLGILIVQLGVRKPEFRSSLLFAAGCIHLFLVAIPMVIVRALNPDSVFSSLSVFGVPGPLFHQISNFVYAALVALTVRQLIRAYVLKTETAVTQDQK